MCWFYSLGAFPGENTMPWVHLNFAFMPWVQSRLWATSKANTSQAAWFHWVQSHWGQSIIFLSPKIAWILHKEKECSDIALNNFLCPECVCDTTTAQGRGKGRGWEVLAEIPGSVFSPNPAQFNIWWYGMRSMRVPKGGCCVRDKKHGNIFFFFKLHLWVPVLLLPSTSLLSSGGSPGGDTWLNRWLCHAFHGCGERKWTNYRSPNSQRITESFQLGKSPRTSESSHEPVSAQCPGSSSATSAGHSIFIRPKDNSSLLGAGAAPHFSCSKHGHMKPKSN